MLIDAPTGISTNMQRVVLEFADEASLLTTPEPTAVMDAYAVLEGALHARAGSAGETRVVNMISSMDAGKERIAAGIDEVARRKFLNRRIETVAQMPFDPNVPCSSPSAARFRTR